MSTGDKLYLLGGLTATNDDEAVPLATVYSLNTENPGGTWIKEDELVIVKNVLQMPCPGHLATSTLCRHRRLECVMGSRSHLTKNGRLTAVVLALTDDLATKRRLRLKQLG